MKIAIPLADDRLAAHFGHCEEFAMIEVDPVVKEVRSEGRIVPPPHEPGLLPRWLAENGADVIIASGMGTRAIGLFSEQGIEVVLGAAPGAPTELAEAYLGGTLRSERNPCDH